MLTSSDCIPCMLEQALRMARRVNDDPWLHRKLLFAVMEHLPTLNFDRSPAELSFDCLRFASKYLGVADPYKDDKDAATAELLAIENDLRRDILAAEDPLRAAIAFSLAGNVGDLGTAGRDAGALRLAIDDYGQFHAALADARSVLYILDKAGEVVCDKLVIEQLHAPEITCVVRAAPIINDVTSEDIEPVGLGRLATIVDIGVEALGVPLNLCSADFRGLFGEADVVISRGQANLETLDDADREVFHILRARCEPLARHLAVPTAAAVLLRTPRGTEAGDPRKQETTTRRS